MTDAGQRLDGTITFISPKAEFTPRNVQTADERSKLVYRIKVTADNKDGVLKPACRSKRSCRVTSRWQRDPVRWRDEAVRRGDGARRASSFDVARGEMFGVIGPDGAGKTTAIRLACGLLRADARPVAVLGRDPVARASRDHRARSATCRSASASTAI